jgi:hypothetical protein
MMSNKDTLYTRIVALDEVYKFLVLILSFEVVKMLKK